MNSSVVQILIRVPALCAGAVLLALLPTCVWGVCGRIGRTDNR